MNAFFDNDWFAAATQYECEIRYKPVRELCNAQYVHKSRHLLRAALDMLERLNGQLYQATEKGKPQ